MVTNVVFAVPNPVRTEGLITHPKPSSTNNISLVELKGPGYFLSFEISKQGGDGDLTFIILDIDDKNVVNTSVIGLLNEGLTSANPYGLSVVRGNTIKTITFALPYPLAFQHSLKLSVNVSEPGVVQILANLLSGS